MRYSLIFILAIFTNFSFAQDFHYPSVKSKGKIIADFIPDGWAVLDSTFGDLNKDQAADAAIVIQHKDSVVLINNLGDTVFTQPRVLFILFKNTADNSYELAEQSNSFILKHDNTAMDEPYMGCSIMSGVLAIKFQLFYNMGSWYVTNAVYKFRYQQGVLVLIGADKSFFHRATHDFEDYSYNFLTKKRSLSKGNENKGVRNTTTKKIRIQNLKTLKTLTEPFTWQIEQDIFL